MFFFQTMFQQVYNGITHSNTLNAVTTIAQGILLLCALFGVYEAYSRGGDARSLALVGVRFLFMGLVIAQYSTVFIAVNNAAANLANQISPNDVFATFRTEVGNWFGSLPAAGNWWKLVTGGAAALVSTIIQVIAVIVFPITMTLFSFFYSMYGAMLYVVGPLVLALYPAFGIGHLARTYMVNLLIWNCWGILYAIMSQLLSLMSAGSLTSIFNAGTFGGAFVGASQMLLLSLSAILLSLMIALIPFIAKRVVSGDVGSTMFAALAVATTATRAVGAGLSAMAGGFAGGGGPPPPNPPGPPGGGGGGASGAAASSSTAPTAPGASEGGSNGGVIAASSGSSSSPQGPASGRRQTGGGGGGGGGNPPPGRRNSGGYGSEGYPIGLGPRNVLQSGLYAMPAMVGWAVGRTARARSNRFNSSKEEA
jgi:hypothetical protein